MDPPLIGTFPATTLPDGGLTPDVVVPTTADDIAHLHRMRQKSLWG